MAIIELTQGKKAVIDDIDIPLVAPFKWCAVKCSGIFYASAYSRELGRSIYLHRLILGFPPSKVDHKNHDGLDCRRENIRIATNSQNGINSRLSKKSSSGFRGVYLAKDHSRAKPYVAKITIHGKRVFKKYFSTAIEAAKAYDEAADKYHGEFALKNF